MTTAIILAGGLGTRLRSVLAELPKPMAPIEGKPFLVHQLDYWITQGIARFIISVGYKAQMIMDYFGSNYKGIELSYVHEESPLGTGGALMAAVEKLNKEAAFLLLNGDTYFAVDLKQLINFSNANHADWCFSLFSSSNQERYLGLSVLSTGQIAAFHTEETAQTAWVNGGVYWVQKPALLDLDVFFKTPFSLEKDFFPTALDAGQRLFGLKCTAAFIDIGIPVDYYRARQIIGHVSVPKAATFSE